MLIFLSPCLYVFILLSKVFRCTGQVLGEYSVLPLLEGEVRWAVA